MPYTLTHRANHTVEISAHLESAAVDREREGIIRTFRSKARVPGFRPGKAPAAAVRARFADEIREELQEHLTGLLWGEVFDGEKEIEPITNPHIRELSFTDDGAFSFIAELEVRPRYDLPDLTKLGLPEVSLEISETEIDEELTKVQEEQAVWEPAEDDEAADGMLAEVDLRGEVEGSDDDPYTEDGASLIIGSDSVPPEINEALQGAKTGDERVATKTLPADLEDKNKAGKTVTYTISVKGLKRKVLPEIDDDLATTIGLENLEELRQRIRDVLKQQKRESGATAGDDSSSIIWKRISTRPSSRPHSSSRHSKSSLTDMRTLWPCGVWSSTQNRSTGTKFPRRRNRRLARKFSTPSFSNSLQRPGKLLFPKQRSMLTSRRKPRATACRLPSTRRIWPLKGSWSASATRRVSQPRWTR